MLFFYFLFTAVRPQAHIQKAVNKNGAAMAALGHASHDLSLRCRQAIRPLLQHSLSAHCSDSQTVAQCLFGDNLAQSIKDLKEIDRIGSAVATSSGNQTSLRHNNPRSNSGFGHPVKNKPFLGYRSWGQLWNHSKRKRGGQSQFRDGNTRPYNQTSKRQWT